MTGKAMVPITESNGGWEVTLQEQRHALATDDELRAMEKRIRDRGYYPIRLTRDELTAWSADQALVDARFKDEMLRSVEAWMALADERLGGTSIRCVVSPRTTTCSRSTRSSIVPSTCSSARRTRFRSTGSRSSRPAGRTPRRGTPSASCRRTSSGRGSTVSLRRCRTEPSDLQLPRAAVWLQPRLRAAARRRHEVRGRRPGARAGRLEGGPRNRSSSTAPPLHSTAISTKARAR